MWDSIRDVLQIVFVGDAVDETLDAGQISARAVLVFFIGLISVRLGKSRMLSRASPLDVLMLVILGSLLSRGINGSGTLSGTIAATVALVLVHWVITAAACRSHTVGQWIKGHAYVLIRNGRVVHENLRRSHMSEHDLAEELRLNANIDDPALVTIAYKERSGDVGVVLKKNQPEPQAM